MDDEREAMWKDLIKFDHSTAKVGGIPTFGLSTLGEL
jgi:hypothetical protein